MISAILEAVQTNFLALPGMGDVLIGYVESISDQAGPRQLLMYPLRGQGKGPNFYTVAALEAGRMIRKRLLVCQFEIWGNPASATDYPDGQDQLLHGTDDTELMLGSLVNAINWSVPGGYQILDEDWNTRSAAQMNGRCCKLRVGFECPIPMIDPTTELAPIAHVSITASLSNP